MKNLILLNENTQIKLNDTGTVIQFKAQNEGQPVSVTSSQTATFRIKNEFGFVKSVPASTNYGGYMFELDTSKLDGLVVGKYELELKIELDADDSLIFPDSTFVGFEITANALNITGEQLPMMSLEEFKDELKSYVDDQTTTAETAIKNDFQSYVDGLSDSTIATANKASEDAQTAITTANGAVDTANTAKSTAESAVQTANTAKSTADTALSKVDTAQSTADSVSSKAEANASLITAANNLINKWNGTTYLDESSDWNNLPTGIYYMNGWGNIKDFKNAPSFLYGAYEIVIVFGFPEGQYQIVLRDVDIYYRVNEYGNYGTWKKVTFTS